MKFFFSFFFLGIYIWKPWISWNWVLWLFIIFKNLDLYFLFYCFRFRHFQHGMREANGWLNLITLFVVNFFQFFFFIFFFASFNGGNCLLSNLIKFNSLLIICFHIGKIIQFRLTITVMRKCIITFEVKRSIWVKEKFNWLSSSMKPISINIVTHFK